MGLAVFLIFFLVAPLISKFYNQSALTSLIRVFAIVYVIGSLNIVQEALMQKRMEFRRLFLMDLFSVIISGIIAIVMANRGYGVWSLVVQYISMITVSTIILWITSSWKPVFQFHRDTYKKLRGYSLNLFVHDVIYFFGRDTDKFLIGKYLGPVILGVYYRAFMLMLLPVNQINIVITRVMFPVLSALQGDLSEMRHVYLRTTNMISFISFPVLALLFIIAEPLVIILLGPKWTNTVIYLKIFCIYGMLESIGTTIYWIYKSLGRTDILLKWGVINTACIIPAVALGLWWNGAIGVAVCYVAVQLFILWIPGWSKALKLIDLDIKTMLLNIGPNFINAVLSMPLAYGLYKVLVYGLPKFLSVSISNIILVICVSLVYGLTYITLSFLTKQSGFVFVTRLVKKKIC